MGVLSKVWDTVYAPVHGLIAGDPLMNKFKTGKWDFNPDNSVNRATNTAAADDGIHRALGINDSDFARAQRIVAGGAGLIAGGAALGGMYGGSGVAGGSALPSGGMVGTGSTSGGDLALMGGGGASPLPAGGMTATGAMSPADSAMMGAGNGTGIGMGGGGSSGFGANQIMQLSKMGGGSVGGKSPQQQGNGMQYMNANEQQNAMLLQMALARAKQSSDNQGLLTAY